MTIIPKQIACLSTDNICEENPEIRRVRQKVRLFRSIFRAAFDATESRVDLGHFFGCC